MDNFTRYMPQKGSIEWFQFPIGNDDGPFALKSGPWERGRSVDLSLPSLPATFVKKLWCLSKAKKGMCSVIFVVNKEFREVNRPFSNYFVTEIAHSCKNKLHHVLFFVPSITQQICFSRGLMTTYLRKISQSVFDTIDISCHMTNGI